MRYLMLAVFLFASLAYAAPGLQEAPEGNYDLVAVELVHIPEQVVVGDEVVFVQHLANRGTDAIPGRTYRIDLYVDDERVSYNYSTRRLRPGGSSTYSKAEGYYHFKPTEPGTYTYRWVLDKEGNLPETDETNNVIEGTIVVAERSAEHDRLQAALLDQLKLIGRNMVEGRYPPELELGPDSTHKELQWFTELFDEFEVKVYSRDYYSNYLTPRESVPPRERATHRLAFRNMSESEWPALFVQYFDGQEWAKQATSEFYRDNQVTMTFRVAHDEQTGTFRLLELSGSGMRYRSPDERSWLGVWLIEKEGGVGAVVRRVEDSSPAQEAGFEPGDTLLTLADKPITSRSQLNFLLSRMKPGTEVSFGLVRNGVQMEKTVQLGTQPERRR
ncbi:MAG: PDZ domain-containing protein [Gemmatimonadota bacterium]|nr:PDZ domain-containing protein [Gemmatimonadota bacterium]